MDISNVDSLDFENPFVTRKAIPRENSDVINNKTEGNLERNGQSSIV